MEPLYRTPAVPLSAAGAWMLECSWVGGVYFGDHEEDENCVLGLWLPFGPDGLWPAG